MAIVLVVLAVLGIVALVILFRWVRRLQRDLHQLRREVDDIGRAEEILRRVESSRWHLRRGLLAIPIAALAGVKASRDQFAPVAIATAVAGGTMAGSLLLSGPQVEEAGPTATPTTTAPHRSPATSMPPSPELAVEPTPVSSGRQRSALATTTTTTAVLPLPSTTIVSPSTTQPATTLPVETTTTEPNHGHETASEVANCMARVRLLGAGEDLARDLACGA